MPTPTSSACTDGLVADSRFIAARYSIERWQKEVDGLLALFSTGLSLRDRDGPNARITLDHGHNPISAIPCPAGSIHRSSTASTCSTLSDNDSRPAELEAFRRQHPKVDFQSALVAEPDALEYDNHVLKHATTHSVLFDLFPPHFAQLIARSILTSPTEVQALMYHGAGYGANDQPDSSESSFPRDGSCFETQDQGQSAIVSTATAPTATSTTSKKRKRGQGVGQTGYTFACPFGILNPSKFCRQFGPDSHGRFNSCQGPGWTDIRHLPEHIYDAHVKFPQCHRCWVTFGTEEDWKRHVYHQEPRCPDNSDDVERIESVTRDVYDEIKKAVSIKRGKSAHNPDAKTRWFTIYNLCFPPEKYGYLPRPTHPYYRAPDGQPSKTLSEITRERLRNFSQLIRDAKWEEARRLDPTTQLSQVTIPLDQFNELLMKSWEFVCRTGPVALDDYNPVVEAIDAPDAEDEEWLRRLEPLVQAARE